MSTSEKIKELLLQGVPPHEIVRMGFAKSTVYTIAKKLVQQLRNAIDELLNIGEGCRKIGSYVVCGKNGTVIVMRIGSGRSIYDFLKELSKLRDGECAYFGSILFCREDKEIVVYNVGDDHAAGKDL